MPTLHLEVPDGVMPLYVAAPDPGADVRGGVVVLAEAFGVNRYVESVCQRLAGDGWHAVAPSLFHRSPRQVFAYDELPAVVDAMKGLTGEGMLSDVDAALRHLGEAGLPATRSGVIGFCMGGTVALLTGARRPVAAAVSFYGGGVTTSRWPGVPPLLEVAPQLQAPWLGLYGDLDTGIPVAEVERLREAAHTAPVPTEVVRFPQAGHGFHSSDRAGSYEPTAAEEGWRAATTWLDRHVPRG